MITISNTCNVKILTHLNLSLGLQFCVSCQTLALSMYLSTYFLYLLSIIYPYV